MLEWVHATKLLLFYTMKGNTGVEPVCGPLCPERPVWNVDIVIALTSWGSEEEMSFIRGSLALRKLTTSAESEQTNRPCTMEWSWALPLKVGSTHVICLSFFPLESEGETCCPCPAGATQGRRQSLSPPM